MKEFDFRVQLTVSMMVEDAYTIIVEGIKDAKKIIFKQNNYKQIKKREDKKHGNEQTNITWRTS